MLKALKNIQINDKNYSYIDYNNGEYSSVRGLRVDIRPETREKLTSTSGFYGDLLGELKKDTAREIKELVMLSLTGKGMRIFTAFYFIGGDDFETLSAYTTEPQIPKFMTEKLIEEGTEPTVINTLEYLAENPDCDLHNQLKHYYSPLGINDTGLYIGDDMVNYGDTLEIVNVAALVEHFDMQDSSLHLLKPTRLIINVNDRGLGMFETIGSMTLERDGQLITTMEEYYKMEIHEANAGEGDGYITGFFKFIENEKINTLHDYALKINKNLSIGRDRMDLDRIINRYNSSIEEELKDIQGDKHTELLGVRTLRAFIQQGFVQNIKETVKI